MRPGAARALPTLAVCACCAWVAADAGGFYPRTWTAVAVVLAGLVLALVLSAWPLRARLPRGALVALAALCGFAAWSFATALWAAAPGDAVRGAVVTAAYLAAFAVPLAWPARPAAAERILLGVAVGIAALGGIGAVQAVAGSRPLVYGRLAWPTGYPNTTAAVLAVGAWLALVVAVRGSDGAAVRALAFAVAVWTGGLLVLARSQGAAATAVVAAVVLVVLARRRVHAVAMLLLGLLVLAPAVPALARVVNQYPEDQPAATRHALVLLAAVSVLAVPLALLADPLLARARRRAPTKAARVAVLAVACALVLAAGVTVSRSASVSAAWHQLTTGPATTTPASRFYGTGLAGNRGDFWRVGLDAFLHHPLGGVGVDNFQATYLRDRRSDEEPRSPHNLVVTALSETGAVGALLLGTVVVALAAALVPAARGPGAAGTVAQASVVALTGWLGHAQLDWLWEMPASGMLALTVAGIGAGSLAVAGPRPAARAVGLRLVAAASAVVVAVVAGALWLSVRYETRGVRVWRADPAVAATDLSRAARLDPLGSDALLLQGAIAEQRGRWTEMRDAFAKAASRDRSDWYAAYELAVAHARLGAVAAARAEARRAAALNPREPSARRLLQALDRRRGG